MDYWTACLQNTATHCLFPGMHYTRRNKAWILKSHSGQHLKEGWTSIHILCMYENLVMLYFFPSCVCEIVSVCQEERRIHSGDVGVWVCVSVYLVFHGGLLWLWFPTILIRAVITENWSGLIEHIPPLCYQGHSHKTEAHIHRHTHTKRCPSDGESFPPI